MSDVYFDKERSLWVYRASALGGCIRGLVAARLGVDPLPPSRKMQQWWHEGNLHEDDILERVAKEADVEIEDTQVEVEIPVTAKAVILGHLDATVRTVQLENPMVWPFEAKSCGQSTFEQAKRGLQAWVESNPRYAHQWSAYVHAKGKAMGIYAAKNRNDGEVVWDWVMPPVSMSALLLRVMKVEECAAVEEYPECDRGCTAWGNQWWHVHSGEAKSVEEVKDEMLGAALERYVELQRQQRAVEEELKGLRSELCGMSEEPSFTIRGGRYRAKVSEVVQSRLDGQKVKEMLRREDVLDQYQHEVRYQRVTVEEDR